MARKLPTLVSPGPSEEEEASTTPPTPCSEGGLLEPDGTSDEDDLGIDNDEDAVTNAITVHFQKRSLNKMRENLKDGGKT